MQKKRILWLYNHSTLMKSEVAILRDLGYEVYVPKVIPFDVSVAVDWESDKLLTIPAEAIEILNKVDFYGASIPREAMNVMNQYFKMAIFGIFVEPLKSLALGYKGIMIFHPFGLEDGASYTKIIEHTAGIWLLKRLEQIGNRFWFGQSYENLMEIECDFFQKRTINLPIGMLDTKIVDKWHGSAKKILFVCPRIRINSYYEKIYKQFKEDFKGLPYSIGGAQPIPVEGDKTILGFLPQKEYEDLYPSHSVMYYHSTNKRHVHYHPFEAVKCGLPLVYMAGGLIDELGGRDLPGRCKTIKEAKDKCRRIIKGDKRLAEKIRSTQGVLLEMMSYDYCKNEWAKALQIIEKNSVIDNNPLKKNKIAFILPQMYRGGVLDYTLRLLKALTKGMPTTQEGIDFVFAVPEEMKNKYYDDIREVEDYGISIRTFNWEKSDKDRIKRLSTLMGYPLSIYRKEYVLMNDGISYFEDCDFLLFMADRVPPNLFMSKPYGVVIHDYMRRYVPEELNEQYEMGIMNLVRRSECNFTTSSNAATDCIQYVGIVKDKIHRLPLFFEDISKEVVGLEKKTKKEYFVWATNINKHKNHVMALNALSEYYQAGGKLHCYVTGINTDLFNVKKDVNNKKIMEVQLNYVQKIRDIIQKDALLKKYIHFEGQLPKRQYYSLLKNAKFMISPGIGDNGNGAVVDAAFLGVPTISSDYPAMRNIDSVLCLGMRFVDGHDYKKMKDAVLWAEQNYNQFKQMLPTVDELRKHTIDDMELCQEMYDVIIQHACI